MVMADKYESAHVDKCC